MSFFRGGGGCNQSCYFLEVNMLGNPTGRPAFTIEEKYVNCAVK